MVLSSIARMKRARLYASLAGGKKRRNTSHSDTHLRFLSVHSLRQTGHPDQCFEKVTGRAKYGRSPAANKMREFSAARSGRKLKSVDTSEAEQIPGAHCAHRRLLAVLHEQPDLADRALALVKAR